MDITPYIDALRRDRIVNVVRAATREHAINVDIDPPSVPFLDDLHRGPSRGENRRMTGWV